MKRIEVLDHGYAVLVESWGSDQRIVEAARMSTDKGFRGWQGDEKLLRYLWTHKHATPFEMGGLIIEVQAPIFVFRQWHRHRTQSYNEMSARYTPLPDVNYVPSVARLLGTADGANKQAGKVRGSGMLDALEADTYRRKLIGEYARQQEVYEDSLLAGVPKELARLHIGTGRYSRMRASANLRNWLAFMTLRCDSHAQYEIRMYAEAVSTFIAERFPRTHALWSEGQS